MSKSEAATEPSAHSGGHRPPKFSTICPTQKAEVLNSWGLVLYPANIPRTTTFSAVRLHSAHRSDLPEQFMRVRAHPAFSPFQADDASSILVGRSLQTAEQSGCGRLAG